MCGRHMKKAFILSVLSLMVMHIMTSVVHAKWDCLYPDSVDAKCEESATATGYNTLRDCLTNGTPDDPVDDESYCKNDPRWVMRNFAALNFWSIGKLVNLGLPLATVVGGLICGAFMLYGAINYISSNGEEKKVADSTHTMTYAMIGLVIVLVAYMVVRTLLIITKTNTFGF
jgi:hypothetical protein